MIFFILRKFLIWDFRKSFSETDSFFVKDNFTDSLFCHFQIGFKIVLLFGFFFS